MIHNSQPGWEWPALDQPGYCPEPEVWETSSERISTLLGPDGEPLVISYERQPIGFDLTPRKHTAP